MQGRSKVVWLILLLPSTDRDDAIQLSEGGLFLLLASEAVGTSGEEATAALGATTVAAAVFATHGTASAVHHASDEETGGSSPHERKGLDAHLGILTVRLEGIATLDVRSTIVTR